MSEPKYPIAPGPFHDGDLDYGPEPEDEEIIGFDYAKGAHKCNRCNYDRHECQGCGISVTHENSNVCEECKKL